MKNGKFTSLTASLTHHSQMTFSLGNCTNNAFLLLELMISLTISTIAITAVLICFYQSLKSVSLLDDYETAMIILQNQLTRLRLEDRLIPGETDITLLNQYAIFKLKQTIKPTPAQSLYRVSLALSWKKGINLEHFHFETFLLAENPFKNL